VDSAENRRLAETLAAELGCSNLLARVLVARGLDSVDKARRFLDPDASDILPPESIPGLEKARDRLVKAAKEKQSVLVHGDYDVDGIVGAVILHQTLKELGCKSKIFLPTRHWHGYGFAIDAVDKAKKAEANLIVTVDCGISSHAAIEAAVDAGIDVIVTDHHALPENLPTGAMLVHPDLDGEYPGGKIAGATVAFKLVLSLLDAMGKSADGAFERLLPLIALATVADVCPLTGENRALVAKGMPAIPDSEIPGLKVLWLGTRYNGDSETPEARDIAFGMAPCINAAGRMGDPFPAAKLLMAKDEPSAWSQFRRLKALNTERKKIQHEICRRLLNLPDIEWAGEGAGILSVADENCLPGLAGLAASRIAEQTGRPTCILAPSEDENGSIYRGSMRTAGDENLLEIMEPVREFVESIGGHPGALGVTVRPEMLDRFLEVCDAIEYTPGPSSMTIDLTVSEPPRDEDEIRDLDRTRPWGEANPQPSFAWGPVTMENSRVVGRNADHVQVSIGAEDGPRLKAIAFSMAGLFNDARPLGKPVRAAGHFFLNNWQGRTQLEFQLNDIELI
jgi:single-stranded-DNA-specific exonuclease